MTDTSKTALELPVLEIIHAARSSHGLRHSDYQRYRQYCAQKIHRVKKVFKLTAPSNKKYTHLSLSSEMISDPRVLEILLFDAERAWAYAMELKSSASQEPRKKHHSIKRLIRASQIAQKLTRLVHDVVQGREGANPKQVYTILSIEAYEKVMTGYVHLERQHWSEAMTCFSSAKDIYDKLRHVIASHHNDLLCQSAIDEIEPNLRYCAYNLRIQGGQEKADIASLLEMQSSSASSGLLLSQIQSVLDANIHAKAAQSLEILWAGKKSVCKNAQVKEKLVSCDELTRQMQSSPEFNKPLSSFDNITAEECIKWTEFRFTSMDKILGLYWECARLVEKDIKENDEAAAKIASSKNQENAQALAILLSYVSSKRLQLSIERNIFSYKVALRRYEEESNTPQPTGASKRQMKRPVRIEDLIKAQISILDLLKESKSLPVTDESFLIQIDAQSLFHDSHRVYHMAELYAKEDKSAEALALLDRSLEYISRSRAEFYSLSRSTSNDKENMSRYMKEADVFRPVVEKTRMKILAEIAMSSDGSVDVDGVASDVKSLHLDSSSTRIAIAEEQPNLYGQLNSFLPLPTNTTPRLVSFPPTFEATAFKPLFYDLAYSGLDFPVENITRLQKGTGRLDRFEQEVLETKQMKQGGVGSTGTGGFLGSVLGGFFG